MSEAPSGLADWLRKWLATVKPGICPACNKPLPEQKRGRRAYIHPKKQNPACRAEYLRRRAAAVGGTTSLKEIRAVKRLKDRPGRVQVRLSCGCKLELQTHAARRVTKRMRCASNNNHGEESRP